MFLGHQTAYIYLYLFYLFFVYLFRPEQENSQISVQQTIRNSKAEKLTFKNTKK